MDVSGVLLSCVLGECVFVVVDIFSPFSFFVTEVSVFFIGGIGWLVVFVLAGEFDDLEFCCRCRGVFSGVVCS